VGVCGDRRLCDCLVGLVTHSERERLIAAYKTIVGLEPHRERNRIALLRLCELIAARVRQAAYP
jgi:hypothetical protein